MLYGTQLFDNYVFNIWKSCFIYMLFSWFDTVEKAYTIFIFFKCLLLQDMWVSHLMVTSCCGHCNKKETCSLDFTDDNVHVASPPRGLNYWLMLTNQTLLQSDSIQNMFCYFVSVCDTWTGISSAKYFKDFLTLNLSFHFFNWNKWQWQKTVGKVPRSGSFWCLRSLELSTVYIFLWKISCVARWNSEVLQLSFECGGTAHHSGNWNFPVSGQLAKHLRVEILQRVWALAS